MVICSRGLTRCLRQRDGPASGGLSETGRWLCLAATLKGEGGAPRRRWRASEPDLRFWPRRIAGSNADVNGQQLTSTSVVLDSEVLRSVAYI
jgi:hypothetical protein